MADPQFSIFAGVCNTLVPERLHSLATRDNPSCDLVAAVNVDIDNAGQARRREGQLTKVAGSVHSLWSDGEVCLYVIDGAMRRLNTDFTSELLALGLSSEPMAYLGLNQRVYHSNGKQTGVLDQGRVRSWGMNIDDIFVNGVASNGLMPAGTYQYAMTWLRNDGQESGTGLANRIDLPDNSGITFDWQPPSDPTITDVAIYLTQPNGETLLQAAVVDAYGSPYSYSGGDRSLALATQWFDAPPAGQALAWHRGRIFIAVGVHLFSTTALGYEWVDRRDFLALDETLIAFVIGVEHGLFIGTGKAVYFLAGDQLDELALKTVIPAAGVAHSAVTCDGFTATGRAELAGLQCVLFASAEGVCLGLPDGSVVHLTQDRYRFALTNNAAACFRAADTLSQYLLVQQS